MLLAACAVIFELCLAVVFWRLGRQRPSIAAKIAAVFIGLAGASSLGLATQGFFLFASGVLQVSELAATVFWLASGMFAIAVMLALRPSPAVATMPCIVIAALSFIYASIQRDTMTALVGAVLTACALVLWWSARRIARQPRAKASLGDDTQPVAAAERVQ
jgi:hypothetical protein